MNLKDYEKALEEKGYKIVGDKIATKSGDVVAFPTGSGTFIYADPRVEQIMKAELPKKKKATKKKKETTDGLEIVRARDENGHFISDDPSTPDVNEAWVVRTAKKLTGKK